MSARSSALARSFERNGYRVLDQLAAPTIYERRVLELRQGDTAHFYDRTFRLGRFLGSGNATQIFELADDPEKVIRIPFLVADLLLRTEQTNYDQEDRLLRIREFMWRFVTQIGRKKGHVKIFEIGENFSYAVVQRVHGATNAIQFLQTLLAQQRPIVLGETLVWPASFRSELTPVENEKLTALLHLMAANQDAIRVVDQTVIRSVPARQYLYDDWLKEWFVVDAE
jgi:hypothetical protein